MKKGNRPGFNMRIDYDVIEKISTNEYKQQHSQFIREWKRVLQACRLSKQDPSDYCVFFIPGSYNPVFTKKAVDLHE